MTADAKRPMAAAEPLSAYQIEQHQALISARGALAGLSLAEGQRLSAAIEPYLDFRRRVDCFLERHFQRTCTAACFQSRRSACCSRDGIITYWADVVVNALHSSPAQLAEVERRLLTRHEGSKCVYLDSAGCLWQVRPLVCAMFLCSPAEAEVFKSHPRAQARWNRLKTERNAYAWPDQPVVFDDLERWFMELGCRSSLMYMHLSPGLVRLKHAHRQNFLKPVKKITD